MTAGRCRQRALHALVLGPAVLLLTLLLPAAPASAHPLDVYLHATYLTVTPSTVSIELDLSPGVLLAPQVLTELDADGDGTITDAEAAGYASSVLQHVVLHVDDQPLALTTTRIETPPYLTFQAGYGTLRVYAQARDNHASAGGHTLFYRNNFTPKGAAYQVNAFVDKHQPVVLGTQHRTANQQQSLVDYRVEAAAAMQSSPGPPAADSAARSSSGANPLLGYLANPSLSAGLILVALGFAALLGALHALTPGHAKTLMAAYLVGSGGTIPHALTLGAVVTFTHTASVIVIGLIALLAGRFLVPGVLVPALQVLAGLLVLLLGLRLLRQRWPRAARARLLPRQPVAVPPVPVLATSGHGHSQHEEHGDGHEHTAQHGHGHEHEEDHSHGGRRHSHTLPPEGITVRSLVAMGVSGGLVPCPEALGVMVLAVGMNRTLLGLGLIIAFSAGLAAVLMGLGLLLVTSRKLLTRFERLGTRWITALPLISAVIVTSLGVALILNGILGDLPVPL